MRVMRYEFGGVSAFAAFNNGFTNLTGAPNVIGGSPVNFVAPGVVGAVIAGGGANYLGAASTNCTAGTSVRSAVALII